MSGKYRRIICFISIAALIFGFAIFSNNAVKIVKAAETSAVTDVYSAADLRKALEDDEDCHVRLQADIIFSQDNAYKSKDEYWGVLVGAGSYIIDLNNYKIEYNITGPKGDFVGITLMTSETKELVIEGPGSIISGTRPIDNLNRKDELKINDGKFKLGNDGEDIVSDNKVVTNRETIKHNIDFKSLIIPNNCNFTIRNNAGIALPESYINEGGVIREIDGKFIIKSTIDNLDIVEKPSSWFVDEIERTKNTWMKESRLFSLYKDNIDREEFSELVVILYEAISESVITVPDINPFIDTNSDWVLKANSLGIANGKGDGIFDPEAFITRQEMATMYSRLLKALSINPETTCEYVYFSDEAQISDFARASIQLMYKLDIIKGEGNGIMSPLKNSTREQAIAISHRIYEKFKKSE